MKKISPKIIFGGIILILGAAIMLGFLTNKPPKTTILPQPSFNGTYSVEKAIKERRSIRSFNEESQITTQELSQILWAAQGITGEDGLRSTPSAGAIYPLEIYIAVGNVQGLSAGIYKYRCKEHDLIKLLNDDKRHDLRKAAFSQKWIETAAANIVICGIYQKTAQKYEERAEQFVHMEVGCAAQNIYLQATALNIATVFVGTFEDQEVQKIINAQSDEMPLCIMPLGKK